MAVATFRPVEGWMNLSQAAEVLLVEDTTISRNLDKLGLAGELEQVGGHEKRLSPTAILRLAQHFKKVALSEVAGAIVNHAESNASPARASQIEAEVQKFIDAQPDAKPTPKLQEAHARFLAKAKALVSDETYRELEAVYRATHPAAR